MSHGTPARRAAVRVRPPCPGRWPGAALAVLALAFAAPTAVAQSPAAPPAAASAPTAEQAVNAALLAALRRGGLVLYLRHATTDSTRPDRAPEVNLDDCATQRPLTDEGRRLARRLGEGFRQARIPVAEVRHSPLCRTRETAQLAFGALARPDLLLRYTSNMTAAQKQPLLDHLARLLGTPVPGGGNRVLVGHGPNLADLTGRFPSPEGTALVFEPRAAGGFDYRATIRPADWPALAR